MINLHIYDLFMYQKMEPVISMSMAAAFVVICFFTRFLRLQHTGRANQLSSLTLPPSPSLSLPLLGHLFYLGHARSHTFLQRLSLQLGPIFTLYLGSIPIIFITSPSLSHQALVQEGLHFATRPLLPSRALLTNQFRNITAAPYGPHWRAVRRNLVQQMPSMFRLLSSTPTRTLMLDTMCSRILTEASNSKGVASVYPNLRYAIFELLAFMCFGFHMSEDELLEFMTFVDERFSFTHVNLRNYFPHVGIIAWSRQRAEHAVLAKQEKLYTAYFKKHKELQKLGRLAPGSYLETLFQMNAGADLLSTEDLITLCFEFLTASTDTTVTTLEWTLAHLVEDRSIQSKLFHHIQDMVGNRILEDKDLPKLPYLQAVIKETLRLHPPADFLLPHAVSEHCTLAGYDIPTNAVVMFHVTSLGRNAEIWEEPLRYRPERFLAADIDLGGSGKDVKMLPFGAGRRVCPGMAFGLTLMEVVLAHLVKTFEWKEFPAGKAVDFSEKRVFTVKMKNSLKAHVRKRNATSQELMET